METVLQKESTKNYGVFTDMSKGINSALGDTSGRTVSRRTAHGFKAVTASNDMTDDTAELVVHLGMISAALGLLMFTPNKGRNVIIVVVFLLVLLFICYHYGKKEDSSAKPSFT